MAMAKLRKHNYLTWIIFALFLAVAGLRVAHRFAPRKADSRHSVATETGTEADKSTGAVPVNGKQDGSAH